MSNQQRMGCCWMAVKLGTDPTIGELSMVRQALFRQFLIVISVAGIGSIPLFPANAQTTQSPNQTSPDRTTQPGTTIEPDRDIQPDSTPQPGTTPQPDPTPQMDPDVQLDNDIQPDSTPQPNPIIRPGTPIQPDTAPGIPTQPGTTPDTTPDTTTQPDTDQPTDTDPTPGAQNTGDRYLSELLQQVSDQGSFTTLARAVEASGLTNTLRNQGSNFTILAPTDDAFAALPQDKLQRLLQPENRTLLQRVLAYHVIPGEVTADQLQTGTLRTLGGGVAVRVTPERIIINNGSVLQPDIQAQNGVVHSISQVLMPEELRQQIMDL